MNQITLIGTVSARDGVNHKVSQNGTPYCNFSLKVERSGAGAKGHDYFRVTCWRQLAERAGAELADGLQIAVMGKHTNDRRQVNEEWTDNWTVHAAEFQVLGTAAAVVPSASAPAPSPAPKPAPAGGDWDDF